MKQLSYWTILVSFLVGLVGATTALIVERRMSSSEPMPQVMLDETEAQFPVEYRSQLGIGSIFPDETYYLLGNDSGSFADLFKSGQTVLLFWSPGCESCVDQAVLWNTVMQPSLLPNVQEIVCLPRAHRDSSTFAQPFVQDREAIFFDDERFRSVYNLVVMPTIIAVNNQGVISAIQYAFSEHFTPELIEAVTIYDVGPRVRMLRPKTEENSDT